MYADLSMTSLGKYINLFIDFEVNSLKSYVSITFLNKSLKPAHEWQAINSRNDD